MLWAMLRLVGFSLFLAAVVWVLTIIVEQYGVEPDNGYWVMFASVFGSIGGLLYITWDVHHFGFDE